MQLFDNQQPTFPTRWKSGKDRMNENIHLGRVVGETEAFVDIELCGHDVRNLLAVHASQCFEMLAPEIREKIGDVLTAYMRGDVAGASLTVRVGKNLYAVANERPPEDEK